MNFRGILISSTILASSTNIFVAYAIAADEIVVRARKQEESIQDVPISVSAFSGADLDAQGVSSLEDIASIAPNMTTSGGGRVSNAFSIRGLSSTANNPGIESGIGLYIDDVYIGKSYAFLSALSDIESLEVLRGPQGTLYGRNTIGGAINVFTKTPGDDLAVNADVTYGNYDQYQVRGSISGPIAEGVVSGSLSGLVRQRDGYLEDFARDDEYQDEDIWGLRGKLLFNIGDRGSFLVIGDYYLDESRDDIQDIREGALAVTDPFPLDDRKIGTDFNSTSERKSLGVSGKLTYDFGALELVSITAYREHSTDSLSDQDFSIVDISFTGRDQEQSQLSQEIRISSDVSEQFSYVAGAYFLHEDLDALTTANLGTAALMGLTETSFTTAQIDTKAYAVFASANYQFTDLIGVSGGLRYSYEDKELDFSQSLTPGAFLLPMLGISVDVPSFSDSYSQGAVTGNASINFTPTDDLLIYGSFSRGFKAGGFNATIIGTMPEDLDFDAEFVNSYEIGVKSTLLDDRVRLNLAGFYLDYSDKQEQTRVATFFQVQNAASATSKGFEVELFAQPTSQIQFTGGLGYTDAEYDNYEDCDPLGADCSGNRLQSAPKWTGSATARFDQPINDNLNFFALGQVTYKSEAFVFVDNSPEFIQEAQTLVNARFGVGDVDGRWQVELWGKNLFDEDAIEFSQEFLGTVYSYLNEPRMFGGTVRVSF